MFMVLKLIGIGLGSLSSGAPLKAAYYTPCLGFQILGTGLVSCGRRRSLAVLLTCDAETLELQWNPAMPAKSQNKHAEINIQLFSNKGGNTS